MDINSLLKNAIKGNGFTISQVAAKMRNERNGGIGISQPSLSDMLKGNIPFSRVEEICNIIGMDMSLLIGSSDTASEASCPHCGKPIKFKTTIE